CYGGHLINPRRRIAMKRLAVLFLVLGVFVAGVTAPLADEPKEKTEKKEVKKDDKKTEEKKEEKKDDKPDPAAAKEVEKLSGTFTVTTFERDGKKSGADELKKMKVVQKGEKWTFHFGDEKTEGVDKVYPDKKPKEIDSTYTNGPDKGKTVKGIYEVTD